MIAAHAIRGRSRLPGPIDPKAVSFPYIPSKTLHLISSVGVWSDAGRTTVPGDGDAVYWWDDQSGAGNHLGQATESLRPLYQTGISGLVNGLEFDGANDKLSLGAGVCASSNATVFVVVYLSSASEKGTFFSTGAANNGWRMGAGSGNLSTAGNKLIILHEGVAWLDTGQSFGTGLRMATVRYNSSSRPSWWINGVYKGASTNSPKAARALTYVGGEGDISRTFTDHLVEIVVSDSYVSDAQLANMNAYLLRKYGI